MKNSNIFSKLKLLYSLRRSDGIRIVYLSEKYTFFRGYKIDIADMCRRMCVMALCILLMRETNTNDHVRLTQTQNRTKKV